MLFKNMHRKLYFLLVYSYMSFNTCIEPCDLHRNKNKKISIISPNSLIFLYRQSVHHCSFLKNIIFLHEIACSSLSENNWSSYHESIFGLYSVSMFLLMPHSGTRMGEGWGEREGCEGIGQGVWQKHEVWTSEACLEEGACAKHVSQVGVREHRGGRNWERAQLNVSERASEYRAPAACLGDVSSPGASHSQMLIAGGVSPPTLFFFEKVFLAVLLFPFLFHISLESAYVYLKRRCLDSDCIWANLCITLGRIDTSSLLS